MKKIVSIIIAVIFTILAVMPLGALAEGTPTFSISSATANAGEKAEIKISLKNNPGIASAKLTVEFGSDLTLEKIVYGNKLGGMSQQPQTLNSPVILNWVSPSEDLNDDVVYATLKFSVSKTAKSGNHNISISYNPKDVFNIDLKEIEFKTETGVITVNNGTSATTESGDSQGPVAISEEGAVEDNKDDTLTIGASDYGDGNYTGEEIDPFNPDQPLGATAEAENKVSIKAIIICIVAAVLVIATAIFVWLKFFKKKTVSE